MSDPLPTEEIRTVLWALPASGYRTVSASYVDEHENLVTLTLSVGESDPAEDIDGVIGDDVTYDEDTLTRARSALTARALMTEGEATEAISALLSAGIVLRERVQSTERYAESRDPLTE